MSANTDGHADPLAEIARLRQQVESLMRDTVTATAEHMEDVTREKAEQLARKVRAQPLTALLIAAGVGFLIGRALR